MALTSKARELMERATATYQADVVEAKDFLLARGIDGATAKRFRLGVVKNPIIGHEQYTNRLAIPYITPSGVVDIRFRCIQNHDCKENKHGKYMSQPGHRARLYNTTSIMTADDTIAITEGEMDAIILNMIGIPAVGVPGAQAWNMEYYTRIFQDFTNVFVFGDGDEAGFKFARTVAATVEDATIIDVPTGFDVNDLYLTEGKEGILKRVGLLEEVDELSEIF